MANFTCDICGGTIKMQGSQGGVCQNCGMEYDIEAIRAKVNTAPHQAPTYQQATPAYQQQVPMGYVQQPVMSQPTNQQGEIDRQALLIHLNDLRTMETILYESKNKRTEVDEKTTAFRENVEKVQVEYGKIKNKAAVINKQSENDYLSSSEHIKNIIAAIILFIISGIIIAVVVYICIRNSNTEAIFPACLMAVPTLVLGIKEILEDSSKKKEHRNLYRAKSKDIKELEASALAEKEKYESVYSQWKEDSKTITNEIITEEQYTRGMLNKAYDANIIPLQFRTIEGVYYLYDYLSTSNQTLAEALLQANLEAIKQRLEQVIESQGKLIVEQQQANAKLANIQQTNQQKLENAKRTAINTAQAAKYAQIAATNTELLTKLNKKQLAYQRADFWLK